VALGNITDVSHSAAPMVTIISLLVAGTLLALRVKGALLIGILVGTLLGIPLNLTIIPSSFEVAPPSLSPIFMQFEWSDIFSMDMVVVCFTFLFVDMFDTVGTLIGVSSKANLLDSEGRVPRAKQALMADAIGTTAGAMLGTSTVTTYVESAAGVAEGGRTGLTALTTGILFLLALLFSPIFLMIPSAATASALILVGAMMMTPIKNVELDDYTELIPVFFTVVMMPLTFSISDGIMFGVLSYVFFKILSGRIKEVSLITIIVAILFIIKFYM
ncbi:MAG TPA: NCS2 family permease, partial [Candidatus Kapabacteria bacterium]|nr:NCS2 family permease [Candidatus Kapabacteria bacterium]